MYLKLLDVLAEYGCISAYVSSTFTVFQLFEINFYTDEDIKISRGG